MGVLLAVLSQSQDWSMWQLVVGTTGVVAGMCLFDAASSTTGT